MIKVVALLRKKEGMPRDDFISYYENRHAPLAQKLIGMGHDYRRNYVYAMQGGDKEMVENSDFDVMEHPDFDVMAEVWFPDRTAYEASRATSSEVRAQLILDEEHFLDRSATRVYLVDERVSQRK
jgi:uncharacterized protein (TIGR02118 family)